MLFEGFETDGLNTRYTTTGLFSDGADDYFTRTDGATEASGIPSYTSFGGSYFWAAEDIDASDNPTGLALLDFSSISLTDIPSIQISLDLGAGSSSAFDSVDDFLFVQYRVDGGAWENALAFQNDGTTFNGPLLQDTNFDGIGDTTILDLDFQTFTSSPLAVNGSLLDLRIDTFMTGGGEAVAFDNITITAVPEPTTYTLIASAIALLFVMRKRFFSQRENESQT